MILVRFRDLDSLRDAASRVASQTRGSLELFAPFEFETERRPSPVPLAILLAGFGSALLFFLLETYSDTVAWRMNIGGRPDFSWPVYVGNAVEVGVLCAVAAGLVALFIACRLPRLSAPVDHFLMFREASRDGFFLLLDSPDPAADRAFLESLHPLRIEERA